MADPESTNGGDAASARPRFPGRLTALRRTLGTVTSRRAAVVAGVLAIWALSFAVQVDKPPHVDDTHYLYAARHLLQEPWCPFCDVINWNREPVLGYQDNINPPLFVYLQAAWIALFGDSLPGLHLLSSLATLLAAAAIYLLARRFCRHPLAATALLMLGPAVLPISNLMVDVPSLAFGAAAVLAFVTAVDARSRRLAAVAGGLLTAALLTKYSTIVLAPVFAVYAVLKGGKRYLATLLLPAVGLLLWTLDNWFLWPTGEIHLAILAAYHPFEHTLPRAWLSFYTIAAVVGSSFFVPGFFLLRRARLRGVASWGPLLGVVLFLTPTAGEWWRTEMTPGGHLDYFLFAANSLLLVTLATLDTEKHVKSGPRRRRAVPALAELASILSPAGGDTLFLWLWFAGYELFVILAAYHEAPRYQLLALLPFVLLVVRGCERAAGDAERTLQILLGASVALGLAVGLLVTAADDVLARSLADFPAWVERHDPGRRVFCLGHWGLQLACESRGFATLDADRSEVRDGDLFIVPTRIPLQNLPDVFTPRPHGRDVCDGAPLLRRVAHRSYPPSWERESPGDPTLWSSPTARLTRALYALWPVGVMDSPYAFLYASHLPAEPYSLLEPFRIRSDGRRGRPIEYFELLEAQCDVNLADPSLQSSAGRIASGRY